MLQRPCVKSQTIKQTATKVIAKGDSAASHHYWKTSDIHVLSNIHPNKGICIHQPDSTTLLSAGQGNISISNKLTKQGTDALIVPGLCNASLISLGQLCDDDCQVLLQKHKLCAIKDHQIILEGYRNHEDGLWDIPIESQCNKHCAHHLNHSTHPHLNQANNLNKTHKMAIIIQKRQTKQNLIQYLHAACFSPVTSTWVKAYKNNKFLTWPGLTETLF